MRPYYQLGAIFSALAVMLSTAAANEIYRIDPAHSAIGFQLNHMMGKVVGKFTKFDGKIDLNRDHPLESSVAVRIQVNSIDTGIAKRDEHLRSVEFFDVAKYPEIAFKSRSVKQTGAQSGDILGDLTMHGVSKPITLHVKLTTPLRDERSRWEVIVAPVKRRDFGLMFSPGLEAVSMIGQEVTPKIQIEAAREK